MGTTNARTTPALWTTLAALTLLTAGCTKPEAPPTVQATTPPPREQHPLVVAANKMGVPIPNGDITEVHSKVTTSFVSATVGELVCFYDSATGKTHGLVDMARMRMAAKRSGDMTNLTTAQYEEAAANVLARWRGEPMGGSWRAGRVQGLGARDAREGTVTVHFENVQHGFLVAHNLANATLARDTGEFIGVHFGANYSGKQLTSLMPAQQAEECARQHMAREGRTTVSTWCGPIAYRMPYRSNAATSLRAEQAFNSKVLPLTFVFVTKQPDRKTYDVLIDAETGDFLGERAGPK